MSAVRPRTFMIEHVSDFQYAEPAHGSWMVLRLRPREDQGQRVLRFDLHIDPLASATPFEDSFGNACHLFNVHREHRHVCVHAKTQVETAEAPRLVDHMTKNGWDTLAERVDLVHSWEFLKPSRFARASPTLDDFAAAHGIGRGATPLSTASRNGVHAPSDIPATNQEPRRWIHRSNAFWKRTKASVRTTRM